MLQMFAKNKERRRLKKTEPLDAKDKKKKKALMGFHGAANVLASAC